MAISRGLTLFTSDSRVRYASDILAVLALPDGFMYHFRYDARHISTENRRELESDSAPGTRLLIAFKDEKGSKANDPYIVPVRWAKLVNVEILPDFYVINFVLQGYPAFVREFTGAKDQLIAECRRYLAELSDGTRGLPVQQGLTPFVDVAPRTDRAGWIDVAKRLALHSTFSETHFLRLAELRFEDGRAVQLTPDGEVVLPERAFLRFQIDFLAVNLADNGAELSILSDSSLIRVASRSSIPLDARYDSAKVLVQAGTVPGKTATAINAFTKCGNTTAPQTSLTIPILLVRAPGLLVRRLGVSALGATLVATPGILGSGVDEWVRLAIALAGAALVAIGAVIGSAVK